MGLKFNETTNLHALIAYLAGATYLVADDSVLCRSKIAKSQACIFCLNLA